MSKHIRIYDLTMEVYDDYRAMVKGNEDISLHLARLKLSRNIELSKFVKHDIKLGQKFYQYGKLMIRTDENYTITGIWNKKKFNTNWKRDCKRYDELNEMLGIK